MISAVAVAQSAPLIGSFSNTTTYPGDTIIISGSGFSGTPSNLQVWFGQVMGTIVSSTNFSIKVIVPPQARYGNVEVINIPNKLSTKAAVKFQPFYSGNTFAPSAMQAQAPIVNANQLYDLCSCDLNQDGKPDIAATKFDAATDVLILKNQSTIGTPSFTSQNASVGVFTEEITCGDLNGDGKPELVASRSGGATGGQRNSIYVLPNTSAAGNISFGASVGLFFPAGITGHARYVTIRDLNLDGKPEIIVSNSFNNDLYIFVNESSGGTMTMNPNPIRIPVAGASNLYGLEVQDLDGDSKPEIIITQFQLASIFILKNQSNLTVDFASVAVISGVGFQGAYNKLIAADFDEDGKMDLAASDWSSSKLAIWKNTTSGSTYSFSALPLLDTDLKPDGLDVGDIDGDQDIDIVAASRNQNFIDVFLNSGNNTSLSFSAKQQIATAKNQRNIILADLDGDAKPEIAVTSYNLSNQFSIDIFRNKNCFVPSLITQSPASICPGQTIRLESIPGYGVTFDWKQSTTTIQSSTNSNVAITSTGSFSVTAISESGTCSNVSPSITVNPGTGTVPPDPIITTNSPVCAGQSLQLSTGSVAGATYTWEGPNGFTSSSNTPSTNVNGITFLASGEYSLQITSGFCKSNKKTAVVDVVNILGFTISSNSTTNSTCLGTPLTLSASSFAGFTYQWKVNSANIGGQTSNSTSVNQSGNYTLFVSYPSISGCTSETSGIAVKVLTPPTISFITQSPLCVNTDITFSSSASSFDANGTPVYAWTFGDAGTATTASPIHKYVTAQSFNAGLTGSYVGVAGCTGNSSKSIVINTPAQAVITASLNEICPEEETTLTVSGGTFTNFAWTPTATGNPLLVTIGGAYSVLTTDANGCTSTANKTIATKPTPTVTVTATVNNIASGQTIQLQASGAETYAWSPVETLDNPAIANPMATPLATTTYTVLASAAGQCDVEETITITVDGAVKIPNVFTPNADGSNDIWRIPGAETMAQCLVSIFDKNGSRILEEFANSVEWDGSFNGKQVPPGTYYYIISCPGSNPITGNILVAR